MALDSGINHINKIIVADMIQMTMGIDQRERICCAGLSQYTFYAFTHYHSTTAIY
jgi:hypothetical protein